MKKTILLAAALLSAASLFAQPKLSSGNIDEVLAAMTLEEKATLLVGGGWGSMTAGSLTASDASLVSGAAGTTRAIPRLGIPATVLASTWNTPLVEQLTTAMGEEVVQLYVKFKADDAACRLRGFERVPVKAGETVRVEIAVPLEDLKLWDEESHAWAFHKGRSKVLIGASSQDIRLRKRIRL